MRKIFEAVGFVLLVWGAVGVVHEFTGWFRVWGGLQLLNIPDGYQLFANIVLTVVGLVFLVASDRIGRSA
ncbi:hypothetical protein OG883_10275 [Streptomyces sp. NBC_01142]|uniref:hypothetical protein n=1 Tax=Streptomyces sp. NBC_01142 TaxID=2975865 RepID=UPI00224E09B1|nr:hypothetical protein [Streptomyces sp. NBC_01142]MCX4820284.1 hypothetical protein [Streptomyces sp. NBC_01142]